MALNQNRICIYTLWRYGKAIAIDICEASSVDFSKEVNRKNSKLLVRCNESGVIFKPFVFGSLRNFEEDAVAIMRRISLAQRL
jgi:hypothetical protein